MTNSDSPGFPTDEYCSAIMYQYCDEQTLMGWTYIVDNTAYKQAVFVASLMVRHQGMSREDAVRMLAAWDLPRTCISSGFADVEGRLRHCYEALDLLIRGDRLDDSIQGVFFQGMFAKAIQSLRFLDMNYEDFILPDGYERCARCGYDHEFDKEKAQALHGNCEMCLHEVNDIGIGNGDDHDCGDHQKASLV